MKQITTLLALALCGCAYMHSTTSRSTDPKTGVVTEKTVATGYTMLDAHANLSKFANRSSAATNGSYAPGTYVSGLEQSSSASNMVLIIPGVAGAVVQGLK